MNRKKIISVILTLLLLLACVTACQAASPGQTTDPETSQADALGNGDPTVVFSLKDGQESTGAVGKFDFENRTVLLNSGYTMPILGLGTYALDHDTCVNSVKALLQNGGRLIDTAYMYHNEEAVGEGVRQAMAYPLRRSSSAGICSGASW